MSTIVTGYLDWNGDGKVIASGLNSSATYIVSYWTENNSAFSVSGTISGYPVQGKTETINGKTWTLYVHKVTGQSNITLTGGGHIDELRLYPSTAQMTTYTYSPLVGMTSQTDVGNRVTYYNYDGLGRLKRIRDQDYNILKTYEYQYQVPAGCNGCQSLAMQTFKGTNTIGYPVGVFDIHGNLVGNAAGASAYVSLWNSDTADARVGTLSTGNDSLHFNIMLHTGQTLPAAVMGCRYWQVDLPWYVLDGVRNINGEYVDFGDGTGMHLGRTLTDTPKVMAPNTTFTILNDFYYYEGYLVHTYGANSDTSLKTITFYHNDDSTSCDLDNLNNPATSLTKVRNLRGNIPLYNQWFGGSCYQQASMTSLANIANWNSISSIQLFFLNNGDGGPDPVENISYPQDFMANNKGLNWLETSWGLYISGTQDTSFRLSLLKSDWNTWFTQLQFLQFGEDQWNHEDLSALTQLHDFIIYAATQNHNTNPTNNPIVPLTSSEIDTILMQLSAGAGQQVSNGVIEIYSSGTNHTAASTPAVQQLLSKGWVIYVNNQWLTTTNP
jgi:YD repeat-containing protein